jgi:hypothetical protein
MNSSRMAWRILFLPLLIFSSGCATHALWTKTTLDAFNEPADDARLRVFDAERKKDWLVVYDEHSERNDSTRTRAYFLNQNQKRIEQRRRPDFVSTNSMRGLKPVPVFRVMNAPKINSSPSFYVLAETNNLSLVLYDGTKQLGSYALPVYNDGEASVVRTALTPVTAVADVTIVGGVLGYWFICGLAQSGYSTTFH